MTVRRDVDFHFVYNDAINKIPVGLSKVMSNDRELMGPIHQ